MTAARPVSTVIVIGGGIAGLLAAVAVGPLVDRVLIVDRDRLPAGPAARAGVPHGPQAHVLLASGREAMEDLLPGLTDGLVGGGAEYSGDLGHTGRFWIGGGLFTDCTLGVQGLGVSRAAIESAIRDRVRDSPGIDIRELTEVVGLLADGDSDRVDGVRLRSRADRLVTESLAADLVIDATGRSGRDADWFGEHGWSWPTEDRIEVGLRYSTTHVDRRPGDLGGRSFTVCAATPSRPRGGAAAAQEDGSWVIVLYGYTDDQPPSDDAGYRAFAQTLVSPDVAELLVGRDLLEPPRPFRFAACRRRRFERVRALPAGYVAIGDAICSVDPAFGQGMSLAALEAVALRGELARGATGLGRRFHRRAARIVDRAWDAVLISDLQLAGVHGQRSAADALLARYVNRIQGAARHDPAVAAAFLRVTNLVAAPPSLLAPGLVLRALRRREPAPVSSRP
jgi:2-polyprenyl-6-methoxyphenol hydroxylase-like FAD-dependent oxidoreductase